MPGFEFVWTRDMIDLSKLRTLQDSREAIGIEPLRESLLQGARAVVFFDDAGELKFLRDDLWLPGNVTGLRLLRDGLSLKGQDVPLYVLGIEAMTDEAFRKLAKVDEKPSRRRPSVRPARKRGPKSRKLHSVIERMRAYGGYETVRAMTEEEMVERFKASRDTCRKARDALFAEVRTH